MPLVPSHLEKELAATLGRPGGFLTTSAAFARLAQAASRRLVVMTPFIDAGGFRWLRRVFEATRTDCQKIVVLRNTDQYTVELGVQHADWLRVLQVSVRDYLAANPLRSWSVQFSTWESDWDPNRALKRQTNLAQRIFAYQWDISQSFGNSPIAWPLLSGFRDIVLRLIARQTLAHRRPSRYLLWSRDRYFRPP